MDRAGKWSSKGRIVSAVVVTPHDTNVVQYDALFIGTQGNVEVTCRDNSTPVIFKNIGAGEYLVANVKLVKSAGTTAADILGLLIHYDR